MMAYLAVHPGLEVARSVLVGLGVGRCSHTQSDQSPPWPSNLPAHNNSCKWQKINPLYFFGYRKASCCQKFRKQANLMTIEHFYKISCISLHLIWKEFLSIFSARGEIMQGNRFYGSCWISCVMNMFDISGWENPCFQLLHTVFVQRIHPMFWTMWRRLRACLPPHMSLVGCLSAERSS